MIASWLLLELSAFFEVFAEVFVLFVGIFGGVTIVCDIKSFLVVDMSKFHDFRQLIDILC